MSLSVKGSTEVVGTTFVFPSDREPGLILQIQVLPELNDLALEGITLAYLIGDKP